MDLNELLGLEQIALLNVAHADQAAERVIHAELAAYYASRIRHARRKLRVAAW